jgi:hypothetical protein
VKVLREVYDGAVQGAACGGGTFCSGEADFPGWTVLVDVEECGATGSAEWSTAACE